MSYAISPPPRPVKPPLSNTDRGVSIAALVLTVMLGAVAAVLGFFSLAFLDYCPPESCSAQGAFTAVATALLVAGLIGLVGLAATIVQIIRRKPVWPFAVATLVLCAIACFIGGVGYASAVGGG
jgi:hypothetical protein